MIDADLDAVRHALHDHILAEILFRKTPLAPDEDLFEAGFDSMSLARVLVFVEKRFGVVIPDEEILIDEVSTLHRMASFVAARVAAARG